MLFGTAKRLSGFDGKELNLSLNGSRIDMTTKFSVSYWLNFLFHFAIDAIL